MILRIWPLILGMLCAPPLFAAEPPTGPEPTQVMVLGTFHWANPGRDMVNMQVDDVLGERRQREIEILARTLAAWKPTKIVVEWEAEPPGFAIPEFADSEALLATRRNESIQLGFRLARMLGHGAVYGFDEQRSEREPNYFPMGKVQQVAEETGQAHLLHGLLSEVQARVVAEEAALAEQSIAEALISQNDPVDGDAMHNRLYYSLIQIGDGHEQPGAELNAYWFMRNAKMFGKLDMIAEPGDRVLVIVGSGHATWLRHFAAQVPGYQPVDPRPYLVGAEAAIRASPSL